MTEKESTLKADVQFRNLRNTSVSFVLAYDAQVYRVFQPSGN